MECPKVSILVTIYNSEKYLRECLDSLLNQTLKDIEIICINDGSTDSSKSIINEYIHLDSRFILLDKSNSGYGASMNMGMDLAKGEYIGIVESDDFVELDMFETLYQLASTNKVDLIKSDFYRFTTDESGNYINQYMYNSRNVNKVFRPSEYPKVIMNTTANWTGLYRREYLYEHNIRHNETPGASYQDIGFHILTLSCAERAYYVDRPFYHYRFDNPNSSINNPAKVYCAIDEYKYVEVFYNNHPELKKKFNGVMWARMHITCVNTYARISEKYRDEFLQKYCIMFKRAMKEGLLIKDNFSNGRWIEMLYILENPQAYKNKIKISEKRKQLNSEYELKHKKIPLTKRFILSYKEKGLKQTILGAYEQRKSSKGIKHWDIQDKKWEHTKIKGRIIQKKLGLITLNSKSKKIKNVKNRHLGDRCFVVCTGPSLQLSDLKLIENEYTFGMNTIFLAYDKTTWRPTYYTCIDAYAQTRLSKEYDIDYLNISKKEAFISDLIKTQKSDKIIKMLISFKNHTKENMANANIMIEEDPSLFVYDCFSVTNFALLMAIYMGFKEIYIIGCDCNYDGKNIHFTQSKLDPSKEEKGRWQKAVDLSIEGYKAMKRFADENNVKIYNATRGGHLEIFERVNFDSIEYKK